MVCSQYFILLIIFNFQKTGQICDVDGNNIPPNTPPTPRESNRGSHDWTPYNNRAEFELADFLYRDNQMSARGIDKILNIWAYTLAPYGAEPPFRNHNDLYSTIDSTPLGDTPWESFHLKYDEAINERAPWMDTEYEGWFRDPQQLIKTILSNPDFKNEFDYAPYQEYNRDTNNHRFHNFMSGDWAWKQAVSDAQSTVYLDF